VRDLSDKVAVVTGAGSGIGRATALALARNGARVIISDIRGESAEATRKTVEAAGGEARAYEVDVSSEDDMRAFVDKVIAEVSTVDVVVNNAGISIEPTPTLDVGLERFHKVLAVNYWGVVHGSLFFLPHLLGRPAANLVNVASNMSLMAYSRMAPYASSKFAVRGFTEVLRMELRSTPVRVSLVCPGVTKTGIMINSPVIDQERRAALQSTFDKSFGASAEKAGAAIVRAIERDRPRVLIGPDSALLDGVARLLPASYSRLFARPIDKILQKAVGS
jgi:NAD(P)-dependent dehydrogenase (short-subunit alcohol dehydrogenase family)